MPIYKLANYHTKIIKEVVIQRCLTVFLFYLKLHLTAGIVSIINENGRVGPSATFLEGGTMNGVVRRILEKKAAEAKAKVKVARDKLEQKRREWEQKRREWEMAGKEYRDSIAEEAAIKEELERKDRSETGPDGH